MSIRRWVDIAEAVALTIADLLGDAAAKIDTDKIDDTPQSLAPWHKSGPVIRQLGQAGRPDVKFPPPTSHRISVEPVGE